MGFSGPPGQPRFTFRQPGGKAGSVRPLSPCEDSACPLVTGSSDFQGVTLDPVPLLATNLWSLTHTHREQWP